MGQKRLWAFLTHFFTLSSISPDGFATPSQALPRQFSQGESQAVSLDTKVLVIMRKLPTTAKSRPLGEGGLTRSGKTEGVTPGANSPSHRYAMPAPSGMGPLAWRESFRLKCKVPGRARGSLLEGAGKAVRL